MADAARGAQQIDGFEHVVQVVRRLAHAHEHHAFDRPAFAGQHHLSDDLATAQLALQTVSPGHAEQATHGTANLGGDTQTIARQQDALHRLAVIQFHQETNGASRARVFGAQAGQTGQFSVQFGQGLAQALGQKILGATVAGIDRQHARPGLEQALLVFLLGAQRTQTLA